MSTSSVGEEENVLELVFAKFSPMLSSSCSNTLSSPFPGPCDMCMYARARIVSIMVVAWKINVLASALVLDSSMVSNFEEGLTPLLTETHRQSLQAEHGVACL